VFGPYGGFPIVVGEVLRQLLGSSAGSGLGRKGRGRERRLVFDCVEKDEEHHERDRNQHGRADD
jgi:hypothetical protein